MKSSKRTFPFAHYSCINFIEFNNFLQYRNKLIIIELILEFYKKEPFNQGFLNKRKSQNKNNYILILLFCCTIVQLYYFIE